MQAGDVKLGAVFANDHQNVIPIFQRPYVWDQEANWLPLWKDIRTAAEEFEAEQHSPSSQEDPRTYFLGAVVLQQRRRPPRRLASSHIIDGQQRLTTLQVLLVAARSVAHTFAADSVAGRFASLVENRPETVHEDFPDDRYKVWPLPQPQRLPLAVRAPTDERPLPNLLTDWHAPASGSSRRSQSGPRPEQPQRSDWTISITPSWSACSSSRSSLTPDMTHRSFSRRCTTEAFASMRQI
ncbi:hypothetical protein SMICM304S_08049 [Streptomyces microflavus]